MIIGPGGITRPMKLTLRLCNWNIVDWRMTLRHKAVFVEFPVLIAFKGGKPTGSLINAIWLKMRTRIRTETMTYHMHETNPHFRYDIRMQSEQQCGYQNGTKSPWWVDIQVHDPTSRWEIERFRPCPSRMSSDSSIRNQLCTPSWPEIYLRETTMELTNTLMTFVLFYLMWVASVPGILCQADFSDSIFQGEGRNRWPDFGIARRTHALNEIVSG